MTDLLARIGVLLVAAAVVFPVELSDTISDGLGLAVAIYGVVLTIVVVAELLDVDLLGTASREQE